MSDREEIRVAGTARPITQVVRPIANARPHGQSSPAKSSPVKSTPIVGEDHGLRLREASERKRLDEVDRWRMGGDAPLFGERLRSEPAVIAPSLPQAAANDDLPPTVRSTAMAVALVPALPASRPAPQISLDGELSDDVGHTIMAMPQIISSQYRKDGKQKRRRPGERVSESSDSRRPFAAIAGVAAVAALTVGAVMYAGGGLDALVAPSASPVQVASLGGFATAKPLASVASEPASGSEAAAMALSEVPEPQLVKLKVAARTELPAAATTSDLTPDTEAQLLDRGAKLMDEGDIAGARAIYEVLSRRGSAAGAYGYARSYDPAAFRSRKVEGIRPDAAIAEEWYRRAAAAGSLEATARLMAMDAGQ